MQDGFIHLSHRPETLIPIGNNFYRSIANPFVVLKLDQSKLSSEVGSSWMLAATLMAQAALFSCCAGQVRTGCICRECQALKYSRSLSSSVWHH